MRRLNLVMIPALLLGAAVAPAAAQTRRAPSITEAVRRSEPSRVQTRTGVTARGVNLPEAQRCREQNDRDDRIRYDGRYDRDTRRDDHRYDDRRDDGRRDDNRGSSGCCADDRDRDGRSISRDGRTTSGRPGVSGTGRATGTGTATVDVRRGTATSGGRVISTGTGRNNDGCGYYDRDDRRDDDRWDDNRRNHR